jgi:tRNA C32,U32 (ribose-2'-O)-methylase TrmJ
MLTVIARWESDLELAACELRFWDQLKNFGIDRLVFVGEIKPQVGYDQYKTMEEALATAQGNRIFMEATGYNTLNDLPPRNEDAVFIFGCTNRSNVAHMQVDQSYRIAEPMVTDMYQTCAAAVALAFWYGQ